ncbi:non-ribosomal peptide synthetase [Marmoricola endophyticus]|uniref:Non-ribosomal peptide synthetase n=1 Tax=Marmoricola endophyticus TaxID=2040280 RepID=A0A917BMS8_9ACTN|nr:non-ribosomal peptide synthetase [Marmoricola endophyticus]GGF50064.1 non-ribosomal peptide synthetase [Marmoricola endophyticus]
MTIADRQSGVDDAGVTALPLTAAQRGLWYAHQLAPDNGVLNIGHVLELHDDLDVDLYRRAWQRTLDEAQALRLRFGVDDDGEPFQVVVDGAEMEIPVVDLRDEADPASAAARWMQDDLRRPRDPREGDLFTVAVLRLADDHVYCYQRIHHIALDGYAATLVMARVTMVYNALLASEDVGDDMALPLSALVEEDQAYEGSSEQQDDRDFWTDLLADRPPPGTLAADSAGLPTHLLRTTQTLDPDAVDRLNATAERIGVSRSSLLLAGVAAYLHRVTSEREVVLSLPVLARTSDTSKLAPGMVSNVVPLRLDVRPETTVAELARQVSQRVRALLPHQRYRPEDLRRDLDMPRGTALGGVAVNILPTEGELSFGGAPGTLHNLSVGPVDDMSIVVSRAPDGHGLTVDVDAHPDLYDEESLERHGARVSCLLSALDDESAQVASLRIRTDADQRADASEAGVATDVIRQTTLQVFEAQARRTPEQRALVSADEVLTFADLDRRANRLARKLVHHGARRGEVVAVALPRRAQIAVSLVGVHKAGAAFLPIDPAHPTERIRSMLEDAQPTCVVTVEELRDQLPEDAPLLVLDDPAEVEDVLLRSSAPLEDEERGGRVQLSDPAYVVFTSGTTGRPKGIVVEHRSLLNLFAHHRAEVFGPAIAAVGGRRLRVAHTTGVSFDAAWDGALWLVDGHELHFVEERVMRDPEALVDYLVDNEIDSIETTPTYLDQLLAGGLLGDAGDSISVVALGGEAVGEQLWERLSDREGLLAYNFFGPAESTVDVVTARIGDQRTPSIGRPVHNTSAYVLDGSLARTPLGITGELYLAGEGLARGYVGRPDLTAERFLADPYGPPGSRMYRTGDLARWRADGTLDFVGRVDRQVKVRGFRIEPAEIQGRLTQHDDVSRAAVVTREDQPGIQQLVAYVVPTPGVADDDLDAGELRTHVAAAVPDYMVPSAFVVVPELPLTVNGKLDEAALPAPDGADSAGGHGRSPRTPEEQLLAGLFAQTLGVAQVSADDDFFSLGGHSLLATRLVSRIRNEAGVELPIRALFEHPTVEELARELGEGGERRLELKAHERPERLPLSYAQRRLWFLSRLEPDSTSYHIPATLRLRGDLDLDALREAVRDVVERHESLRTVFPEDEDGDPFQRILDPGDATIPIRVLDPVDRADAAEALAPAVDRAFDLTADLPLRVTVLPLGEREHLLSLVMHHVVGDGWSLGPLARDLSTAYAARTTGQAPDWSPLAVQYADYALWQRDLLGDDEDPDSPISQQLDYWREQLDGVPPELDLPRDRARPSESTGAGGTVALGVPAQVHEQLAALAGEHDVSVFMVLQAAVATLLSRLGGGTDVPLGAPIAGRTDEALDDLVGFFVNTLVLRTDLSGQPTFDELVDRVRRADLDAYAHQDVPFERVVEELKPERSLSRHPLFQVMLAYQNQADVVPRLGDLEVEVDDLSGPVGAKFDLSFDLAPVEDEDGTRITGTVEYDADIFDAATVEDLARRFERLVAALVADPGAPVADAEITDAEERAALLAALDRTEETTARGTVLDAVTRRVEGASDAVAVSGAGASLTWAELDRRADALASGLAAREAAGRVVGVALERTPDLLVAVLGVLRAGATYLPVDVTLPAGRVADIVADADPLLVLTEGAEMPEGTTTATLAEVEGAGDAGGSTPRAPSPEDAAYVLFTSGSTGRPKGVVVEHGSLANLLASHRRHLVEPLVERLGRPARVAHTTAVSFDASWDPVLWLLAGAELVLADDDTRRDPQALAAWLAEEQVDVLETTPSYVGELLGHGIDDLALVALGGEAVEADLWTRLRESGLAAVNLYGPTETTVDAVTADLSGYDAPVIGRPVDGVRGYVLDDRLSPVPPGVAGELYLAGAGVARGYLGRPDLTAESFLADPHGEPGSRMYRTGDLVRTDAEGVLTFLRRADDQVKVRGYRVEPGEVRAVLESHDDVRQAAVQVREDAAGAARLVAHLVPEHGDPDDLDVDGVRRLVRDRLPDYMVPTGWTTLATLPLTPNGKLDTTALPDPEVGGDGGRAPATPQEESVARLFAEVLGTGDTDGIGAESSFFELGGHSLLATRLVSRVRSELGVELPVRTLFESPTVAGLAQRLPEAASARTVLEPRERPDEVPLSFAQRRLWFLNRLEDSGAAYHIPMALRLRGDLDADALEAALGDVVRRHEVLRTTLPLDDDGEPHQVVHDRGPELERVTIAADELAAALRERAERPFDLTADLPLRTALVTTGDEHVLLLVVHHVASDGWSTGPLGRDLATAYAARVRGEEPELSALSVQYADYALWQRDLLDEQATDDQLAYWTEQLAALPEELDLPTDRPRPSQASAQGGEVPVEVPDDVAHRLAEVAREREASTFMVLQAALAALLSRLGAGEDVSLGSPIAGRTDEALEDLVGFFVNTLVLRTDLSGDPDLGTLLDRVRSTTLDAFAHQDLPFERLVEELRPERSLARHPLFQVMLTTDAAPGAELDLPGLDVEGGSVSSRSAKFDLSWTISEDADGGLGGTLEYAADLFDEVTAREIADRFVCFLGDWLAEPGTPLSVVPLGTPDEPRAELGGPAGERRWGTVLDALTERAAAQPDDTALDAGDTSWTYADLVDRVGRVAAGLAERGAGRGDVVAVALARGPQSLPTLLGVLRSGATYLPLDPEQPAERTARVLERSGAVLVVTGDDAPELPDGLATVRAQDLDGTEPPPAPAGKDAAYVLFTSGSTGEPKGVVVEHAGLARLLEHHEEALVAPATERAGHRLRMTHTTALTFDASWDPVLWMLAGAELVLADDDTRRDPEALAATVREQHVDVVETTPSFATALLGHDVGDLSVLLLGGEAVPPALWQDLRERAGLRSVNLYGPTESTVDSLVAEIDDHASPVVGTPVPGTRALVLDDRLRPVPPGVLGELYLAGEGLARGYLGAPEQTAERFVADPHGPAGARLYRTGDLARMRRDGALVFGGRVDDQVKIRGFRVELGEVEAVLGQAPGVARVAVVAREQAGVAELAAYLVAADEVDLDPADVRRHAAAHLPGYMVPTAMAVLDDLPLTRNGKLDRRALPEPERAGSTGRLPATPREQAVAALFGEVLGASEVGAEDGFFELGGHSLLATRLVALLRERLGIELPVRALFETPTVEGLARRIDDGGAEGAGLEVLLALREGGDGDREPLWCVHPALGLAWGFAALLPYVADRPLLGLQVPGLTDDTSLPAGLDRLVETYLAVVRERQPEGPYHLLGWSLGGVLAHRLAARLEAEGEEVADLTLLDSYPDAEPTALPEQLDADAARELLGGQAGALDALDDTARQRLVEAYAATSRWTAHAEGADPVRARTLLVASTVDAADPPLAERWAPLLEGHPTVREIAVGHDDLMSVGAAARIGPWADALVGGADVPDDEGDVR